MSNRRWTVALILYWTLGSALGALMGLMLPSPADTLVAAAVGAMLYLGYSERFWGGIVWMQ